MAITIDDFAKVWASQSPLTPYEFSESNYKEGWNFIGGTPPSRQMWDFLQKNNDEKMQYLANNYLPLSGGTLTGVVNGVTPTAGDNSTKIATTEFVNAKAENYLPLSGGTLTGVVNGVTPTADDNSTKIATTAWIENIFLKKLVAKLAASTATSISSLNTSSLFYRMLSWALTASGVQYNFTNANAWYICLGALFGGLIIQGGVAIQQQHGVHDTSFSLPISYSNHYKIIASDAGWYNSVGASATSLSVATVFNASEVGYGVNWIAVGV